MQNISRSKSFGKFVLIVLLWLESKSCKGIFFKINFPPMRALKIITGHVIYNPAYTYKFKLKTTYDMMILIWYIWQRLSEIWKKCHVHISKNMMKIIGFFLLIYLHRMNALSFISVHRIHYSRNYKILSNN